MMYKEFILFLGTEDLEETDNFYRNLMGMDLYKDQGQCRIYKVNEGSYLGFCTHIKKTREEKSPIITLVVDDVDKVYEILRSKDIETETKPQENKKFKIYHFFLKDNNGYSVEIQKFL